MPVLRLCLLLALSVAFAPAWAAFQWAGDVQSVTPAADHVDMQLSSGALARVQVVAGDVVRVRLAPTGSFGNRASGAVLPQAAPPTVNVVDTPDVVYVLDSTAMVVVLKKPFRVVVFRGDQSLVVADDGYAAGWDTASGLVIERKYAFPDEHFFGLGERGGPVDRRGRTIFMMNVDWGGYGEFSDPLYASIPFYYGIRGGQAYGIFFDNPAVPFFDMDSAGQSLVTFGAQKGELDYYVLLGPTPADVAAAYGRLTGRTPLPPKWALGYQQSRYGYKSQAQVLALAQQFRSLNIPCDALYLDLDYMDQRHMFTWDPANFPTPANFNATLESEGFKRVNIMEPAVLRTDPLWGSLAQPGYLVTDAAGTPLVNNIFLGDVSWIDFSRPAARTWYLSALKSFLATGVSATWDDLNEPAQNFMPEAVYDFNGQQRTDLEARNLYALNEVALSYQAQQELRPNERPWVLSRAGYAGIQRYAANWSGDTLSTFDSLRVSIEMSASMGLSGQNFFGHDIGGFLGSPSAELFIRWLEFSSYTPLFRNHAVDTSAPREPWQYGAPYTGMARSIIGQRYRMMPYLYSLFDRAATDAAPPLAPVLFDFPADTRSYALNDEFMLGPSLLVAPVYTAGATTRSVYLPAGSDWVDFNTDAVYSGGQDITVSAPLEQIPVFVRAGAIVPQGPVRQYAGAPAPAVIDVHVYPGADGAFDLYEDDGHSMAYAQGVFLRTHLASTTQGADTQFVIQRTAGSWTPPARTWNLQYHNAAAPVSVTRDGAVLAQAADTTALAALSQGWLYDAANARLTVKLTDSANAITVLIRH